MIFLTNHYIFRPENMVYIYRCREQLRWLFVWILFFKFPRLSSFFEFLWFWIFENFFLKFCFRISWSIIRFTEDSELIGYRRLILASFLYPMKIKPKERLISRDLVWNLMWFLLKYCRARHRTMNTVSVYRNICRIRHKDIKPSLFPRNPLGFYFFISILKRELVDFFIFVLLTLNIT